MQPDAVRNTVAYKGKMEESEVVAFAQSESLPAVVPFIEMYQERIFSQGVAHHLLFVGKPDDLKASSSGFAAFKKVAEKLKKKRDFIFVSVNTEDEDAEPVINFFETQEEELPTLFGFQMEPGQRKFRCLCCWFQSMVLRLYCMYSASTCMCPSF